MYIPLVYWGTLKTDKNGGKIREKNFKATVSMKMGPFWYVLFKYVRRLIRGHH